MSDHSETEWRQRRRSDKFHRHIERPSLDPCTPSTAEQERLRIGRVLIYADMVARTGKIQWQQLATWPYQPTNEEITAAIEETDEIFRRQRWRTRANAAAAASA